MKISTILILVPVISLISCQEKPIQEEKKTSVLTEARTQEILQRGGEASALLMSSLGGKLKAALQAGGPDKALDVCAQMAQPSTAEVSEKLKGLTITRVSMKPRNPKNAPDALDKKVLTNWEKQLAGGTKPKDEVRQKDEKTAVFYRPIFIKDVCLKCHGDPKTFPPALLKNLAKLYPDDQATGYSKGNLRGAFRVEFALDKK